MIGLDVSSLASELFREHGEAAVATARARASDMRTHGDDHGAAVWQEVALTLDRGSPAE